MVSEKKIESKTYRVDIRAFLSLCCLNTICAFFIGVVLGPSTLELDNVFQPTTSPPKLEKSLPETSSFIHGNVEQVHTKYKPTSVETFSKVEKNVAWAGNIYPGEQVHTDVRNLDSIFLNDEKSLKALITEFINAEGFTLYSFHCHSAEGIGVSCAAQLLEGHITLHTTPPEGMLSLDIFYLGVEKLQTLAPLIKKYFSMHGKKKDGTCFDSCEREEVLNFWAYHPRGFKSENKPHYLDNTNDISTSILDALDHWLKELVFSAQTPFMRIDIWDSIEVGDVPSFADGLKYGMEPGDPRWKDIKYTTPNRIIFVDGIQQADTDTQHECFEALVHPAMFAHSSPERIVILGGAGGGALKEVLKHDTVTEVKMIEIDEVFVDACKTHMPVFSDCSDIANSVDSCYEDSRVELIFGDSKEWFNNKEAAGKETTYDVIIVSVLDIESKLPQYTKYYTESFLNEMHNSLSDDGVIVIKAGTSPSIFEPNPRLGVNQNRQKMFEVFEKHPKTAAMFIYEEADCGPDIGVYVIVCKSVKCRENWYMNTDAVDFEIYNRIRATKSKKAALAHYDGGTQHAYWYATKMHEAIYCRREPVPYECNFRGFDLDAEIHDITTNDKKGSLEVRISEGTNLNGIFVTRKIKKNDYILSSDLLSSLTISENFLSDVKGKISTTKGTNADSAAEEFLAFVYKNGHSSQTEGRASLIVEVGKSRYIRKVSNDVDANVDKVRPIPAGRKRPPFSPVLDRFHFLFDALLVATRDIDIGEEILVHEDTWK